MIPDPGVMPDPQHFPILIKTLRKCVLGKKKFLMRKPVFFLHTDRERGIWEYLEQPEPDPAGGEGERGAGTAGGQPGEQGGHPQVTKVISDADPGPFRDAYPGSQIGVFPSRIWIFHSG